MGRYATSGVLAGARGTHARQPFQGDFTSGDSYHAQLNKQIEAKNSFDGLPSHIRNRFQNDPGKLLDFLANPENLSEAQKLGIVDTPAKDEPVEVTIKKEPEKAQNAPQPSEGGA